MKFVVFQKIAGKAFNDYFQVVGGHLRDNKFYTGVPNPVPSFPQALICTELPNHYAIELVGGRRNLKHLRIVKRKLDRADMWFGQFPAAKSNKPVVQVDGDNCGIDTIALMTIQAKGELDRRFPGVSSLFLTKLISANPDMNVPMMIGPEASYVDLRNVLLVSAMNSLVRIRHIRYGLLINKASTEKEFRDYLNKILEVKPDHSPVGFAFLAKGDEEKIHLAAQFANIFLMDKLHETSIGSFLNDHEEIILDALNGKSLIIEPYITWQTQSPDPEESAINPDMFIQRQDGYYDIYDLKLPLLDSNEVTTGARRRRRFKVSIEDGIAQLAHYQEFLSKPKNQAEVERLYDVKFKNPVFGLIVGNYENVHPDKVADAKRRLGKFDIIDYDTLLQLYLAQNKVLRPNPGA